MGRWSHLTSTSQLTRLELLDSKLSGLAMTTDSFVDSAVSSTADESNDLVAVNDPDLALISHIRACTPISWIWENISMM